MSVFAGGLPLVERQTNI